MPDHNYIDKFIEEGQDATLGLHNFYDTMLISPSKDSNHVFRVPWDDFFIKYRKELEPTIQFYHVPQTMFYKPKTLSLELYETTELWLSLLRLNNMVNITEFHQPVIQVYNPMLIKDLISIFFKREKKW